MLYLHIYLIILFNIYWSVYANTILIKVQSGIIKKSPLQSICITTFIQLYDRVVIKVESRCPIPRPQFLSKSILSQ